ncbi:hypothetical protein Tco_0601359 [Tanacetum coccineum]
MVKLFLIRRCKSEVAVKINTSSTIEAVNTAMDVSVAVETPANALVVSDGIGYDWSYQAEEGPTDFALMAHSSLGSSTSDTKLNLEIIAYQLGLESLEARIVVHQKNEVIYEKDIAFLKYDVKVRDNSITELKNQLEEALKEKDDLKLKLEKFETSST